MSYDTYILAMDVLDKLSKAVDKAIYQLEELERQEGLGFA